MRMRNYLKKKLGIDLINKQVERRLSYNEQCIKDQVDILIDSIKLLKREQSICKSNIQKTEEHIEVIGEGIQDVIEINKSFKSGAEISSPMDGGCRGIIFYPQGSGAEVSIVKYYEFREPRELSNVIGHFENKSIDCPRDFLDLIK